MNLNLCILAGHLTRDPENRYSAKGAAVGEFGLAINRKWKEASGELKEEVTFLDCVCFGKTAETIAQYFKKGDPIMLEARLRQESWTDKASGQKRSRIKVLVEKFEFLKTQSP